MSKSKKTGEFDPFPEFNTAVVYDCDECAAAKLLAKYPTLFDELGQRYLGQVVGRCRPEMLKFLTEHGWDVNFCDSNQTTPLEHAATRGDLDSARTLLEVGADPNIGCPLFHVAMFVEKDSVSYAQLLLAHGADINQPFIVEGMPVRNGLSQAIESGDEKLAAFLRDNGARMPDSRLDGAQKSRSVPKEAGDFSDAIIAHVNKRFGQVADGALVEIVPITDHPIAIHYVPESKSIEGTSIFFTTGLSRYEMNVPKGQRAFRRAELFVAVPRDWPAPDVAIDDPKRAWPIEWLRRIAAYPIENDTWLGGDVTTIANDDPPKPLGEETEFTAWLLASPDDKDNRIKVKRDVTINMYQMFPLYTEEYKLERSSGVEALMKQVHKIGMPESIDNNRPNVAN